MDARVEAKLGFDKVRAAIEARCSTEYAAARVAEEDFCTDAAQIHRRHLLADEMRLILMFEDSFPTAGYIDAIAFLEPIGKSASIDLLSLGKLRTLLDTLRKALHFFHTVKEGIYPNLQHLAAGIQAPVEVMRRIDAILDRHGDIKDTASDELYKIRRSIKDKELNMSKRMNAILREAQQAGLADAEASVAIRDGKMLIPVTSAKKRAFQGFVYDESATGKTTFMEPAELDFNMAKAYVALDYIAGMPVVSEDGRLSLRKARHPLLERSLRKEKKAIVPLTVELTPEKRILLISGPNAGGKSVCLKTVGLLQYMFQWGMLIPTSESSELPVFDRIMVSIGDDQSLENDLSTYSSFLADMNAMLAVADSRTLVLIDEFGSGTEPAAGGAIAEAILHELDSRGAYGVITTHYTNLKLYASSAQTGVVNGAMQFDAATVAPLFQLEVGLPGSSFAFELARKMGLPEAIVHDAEVRAGEQFVGIERNLRKIARSRRALDEKLTKIRATDKTLEGLTDRYEKELEDIKEMRRRILDEAREEAEKIIRGANKQVENTIRTIKESQARKEETQGARAELQGFLGALVDSRNKRDAYIDQKLQTVKERKEREKVRKKRRADGETLQQLEQAEAQDRKMAAFRSAPLKVGEKVRIKDNGMVGEVATVSTKAVSVIVGNITTKLPLDRVERITANEYKAVVKAPAERPRQVFDNAISERKASFKLELDVRGERVADAIDIVMRYIDDAIMLGVPSVRILHGKGTGALREEIQKYVRTVPGVQSVADEHVQFGGSGVTVVKFD